MDDLVADRVRYVWRECEMQNIAGSAYVSVPVPGGFGSLYGGRQQIVDETCTWSVASTVFLEWLQERQPASYEVQCKVRAELERQVVGQLPAVQTDRLPWVL